MAHIELPAYGWPPRALQQKAWSALEHGCKTVVLAWHRRAGKDEVALHNAAIKAIRANGVYKKINDKYFKFDVYGK